ncbi:isochorismatase family protein [Microbacterium sp. NPDC057650]|uniref:isochorismatase family protein n=1 Tax=unclassified Microbacterium TaxID=2609290 RepID=UPI00366E414F
MATPLRELDGEAHAPAVLADSTVILVDYQNTYTQGVMELEGWSEALDAAAALLERARREGAKVIHVQHDGGEGSPYDIRADIGAIHERVAPLVGEPVVVKSAPNGFVGTDLGDRVDATGNTDVIVVGFMTHMCVTFTSEGAFLRGNRVTVVADACATRALPSAAGEVAAADLHRGALAAIGDVYAQVVPNAEGLR